VFSFPLEAANLSRAVKAPADLVLGARSLVYGPALLPALQGRCDSHDGLIVLTTFEELGSTVVERLCVCVDVEKARAGNEE